MVLLEGDEFMPVEAKPRHAGVDMQDAGQLTLGLPACRVRLWCCRLSSCRQ